MTVRALSTSICEETLFYIPNALIMLITSRYECAGSINGNITVGLSSVDYTH